MIQFGLILEESLELWVLKQIKMRFVKIILNSETLACYL